MPIAAADIRLRYSTKDGTAGNTTAGTAAGSLGKYISTTAVGTGKNAGFDDVTADESSAATKDFRCFFVYNAHATEPMSATKVWLSAETDGGVNIAIAVDPTAASPVGATAAQAVAVASETTAPAGLGTWSSPTAANNGIQLGNIPAGSCKAFWVRRTPTGSAKTDDGVTISIQCGTTGTAPEVLQNMVVSATATDGADPDPNQDGPITEASGLVMSRKNGNANILWTHNDSGGGTAIFAFKEAGGMLAKYTIGGATNNDWEDIAIGPGPTSGVDYLYVANCGSGAANPREIYRVAEPTVSHSQSFTTGTIASADVDTFSFTAPSTNCEAIFVDPVTGDLFWVEKDTTGYVGLYRCPASQLTAGSRDITWTLVKSIQVNRVGGIGATAADISADGKYIIIRNYEEATVWKRDVAAGETVSEAFNDRPTGDSYVDFTFSGLIESIAFNPDRTRVYHLAEGTTTILKYSTITYT